MKRRVLANLSVARVTSAFSDSKPHKKKRRAEKRDDYQDSASQRPTKRLRMEPAQPQPHILPTDVTPVVASSSSTSTALQFKKKKKNKTARSEQTRRRLEREEASARALRWRLFILSPLVPTLCLLLLPLFKEMGQ